MKQVYARFFYGVVDNMDDKGLNFVYNDQARTVYTNIKHPVSCDLNNYFSGPMINYTLQNNTFK